MTKEELQLKEIELQDILHQSRLEYVNSSAKYKVGEYISNPESVIIKVDSISYSIYRDITYISYSGYVYKLKKGELVRTKDKHKRTFLENYSNLVG